MPFHRFGWSSRAWLELAKFEPYFRDNPEHDFTLDVLFAICVVLLLLWAFR